MMWWCRGPYLPKLTAGIKTIGKAYGFNTVCFGHLGDGNLHVNIPKSISEHDWETEILMYRRNIQTYRNGASGMMAFLVNMVVGICTWDPYMPIAMRVKLTLNSRGYQQVFDPNGILNPGKIFQACSYCARDCWPLLTVCGPCDHSIAMHFTSNPKPCMKLLFLLILGAQP